MVAAAALGAENLMVVGNSMVVVIFIMTAVAASMDICFMAVKKRDDISYGCENLFLHVLFIVLMGLLSMMPPFTNLCMPAPSSISSVNVICYIEVY